MGKNLKLKKIICIASYGLAALLLASDVSYSQSERIYKIGISVWTGYPSSVKGFKEALETGGLVECKNVEYLYGKSGADREKQQQIIRDFKEAKVDLVYSLTTPGTTIAKEIMPETTPIVFSIVTYPADSGLIDSFEYSGNNLVGTSNYVALGEYVRLLKSVLPETKTIAIFHRKKEPNSKIQAANLIRLLKKQGIETIDREPESIEELRQMALGLVGNVDVFVTTTDTLLQGGGEKALIEVSKKEKIPILSSNKNGIENGSTLGPVADFYTLGRMSGEMAIKILKDNISPAELESKIQDPPVTLVNRKSMEGLGIIISADQIANLQFID